MCSLTLLAVVLRGWKLGSCLWLDEVLTLVNYVRHPITSIITLFPDQNQHMFYSVLARASVVTFGESAAAIRVPAVIFGVASIWALFLLGRRIVGTREALLACALMTVSYHHVWFSQNARGYTGLLCFTLLSTGFFLRGVREGAWLLWVGYGVSMILGLWTHVTMAFVALSHAAVYAWLLISTLGRTHRWRPFLALVLTATLTLQLYALSLPAFLGSALHESSRPSAWTNPLWALREAIAAFGIGTRGIVILSAGGILFLVGLGGLWKKDRLFVALLVLPVTVCLVTVLAMGGNLWPRWFFFALGQILLVAVHGVVVVITVATRIVTSEARRPLWAGRLVATAAVLMLVVSSAMLPRCYRLPKQDYIGARDFVRTQRGIDDSVLVVGLAALPYLTYYAPDWETAETTDELRARQSDAGSTWLLYAFPTHMEAFLPALWEAVQSDFDVIRVFPGTLGSGEVYVCRRASGRKT
jgi:4-amino-4-deoxy-L-arabinose transferase-like glycosyltransferase